MLNRADVNAVAGHEAGSPGGADDDGANAHTFVPNLVDNHDEKVCECGGSEVTDDTDVNEFKLFG